jgi:NADH dehydrogenase FAD-containing subunit
VFVAGDCADAFGALNAGHTAWAQGGLAAENILTLIRKEEGIVLGVENKDKEGEDCKGRGDLGEYTAPSFGIKVSLGRVSLWVSFVFCD